MIFHTAVGLLTPNMESRLCIDFECILCRANNSFRVGCKSSLSADKGTFLGFVAMVINCASLINSKMERIRIAVRADREFLRVTDVKREDIQKILGKGFAGAAARYQLTSCV